MFRIFNAIYVTAVNLSASINIKYSIATVIVFQKLPRKWEIARNMLHVLLETYTICCNNESKISQIFTHTHTTTFSVQKCATKPRSTDSQNILAFYDSQVFMSIQWKEKRKTVCWHVFVQLCRARSTTDRRLMVFAHRIFCGWAAVCTPCWIRIIKFKKKQLISACFQTL